jgi:hypothetical protein
MAARPQPRTPPIGPTRIDAGAVAHLRYIRDTIEAAGTFTTVPGKGCIAMGITALAAAALEAAPGLQSAWLQIWVGAAIMAAAAALFFMEAKAKAQGLSLRRAVARRFFMTLMPAFIAGGVLTAALADDVSRSSITGLWLLLYGCGLAACGVFAIPAVLAAGLAFMALGTVALGLPPAWSPGILALGFGGLHIALGVIISRDHGG